MADIPKATHSGSWVLNEDGSLEIQCYVMNNGERVLSLRGASKSMGLSQSGGNALIRNLNAKWIGPYLSENLRNWLYMASRNELPDYLSNKGGKFTPFEASLFVDLCKAYVDASHDGALQTENQKRVAERLYQIMSAFAKVGLIAIIDEVTGYQEERDRNELQKILAQYISPDLMPWTKRFPDEFYIQMFRLRKWDYKGKAKPAYAGKLTNEYIYKYLPAGVLEELKNKSPKNASGNRSHRLHQHLSDGTGVKHLDNQLQQTMALMKASENWDEFERLFKRAMGEPPQLKLE